ncbi:MAG: fibronectin type III-like domain-contianing protein [Muribaculaceae bacterium]|nr:fibronectin type III-like domain-contianing protein [Muribaculaceae bacterium]
MACAPSLTATTGNTRVGPLALQPGQMSQAVFTLTAADLAFYDEQLARWTAEPGKFRLHTE